MMVRLYGYAISKPTDSSESKTGFPFAFGH